MYVQEDEMYQIADVGFDTLLDGVDDDPDYARRVVPNFDGLSNLIPIPKDNYSFDMDYQMEKEQPVIECTPAVHPNDPSLDVIRRPQQQMMPMMPHNPVGAVQSAYYLQQQAQKYALGQSYLNQRGPMQYQFNNPNNIPNIRRFQDDMNAKINNPSGVADYIVKEPPKTFYTSDIGLSTEEYRDRNYDREAADLKESSDAMRKNRFGGISGNQTVAPKRLSYGEMKRRRENENTPEVMFDNYIANTVTKSGDTLLRLGPYNPNASIEKCFTESETNDAYTRANTEYENQKKAILSKKPVVYNNGEQPRFFDPSDYRTYVNSRYGNRPVYYPGYGYMNTIGIPDEYGLPTVWFDDKGKFLMPLEEDVNKGNIPIAVLSCGDKKEEKPPVVEKKEDKPNKLGIILAHSVVHSDGSVHVIQYNVSDDTFTEYIKTDKDEEYSSMGKDAIDQYKKDDVYILANELRRYNSDLADMLAWFRTGIDFNDFIMFKRMCQDQLREYRDEDPLCMYKSTIIIAGDTTLLLKPKPVTLERFNEDYNRIKDIEHTSKKLDNIFLKYKEDIANATTLEDKLQVIRTATDVEVIPRTKDRAYQVGLDKIKKLVEIKANNYKRYKFWKELFVGMNKESGDNADEKFAEWWNKPRQKMSGVEFEKAYNERMMDLNRAKFTAIVNMPIPTSNPNYENRQKMAGREWYRLSEGRFETAKTFDDFVVAMNVTRFNIDLENIMRKRMQDWRTRRTEGPDFNRSIVDRVIDMNIENLGLSPVMKLPRYTPVSLSGIDKTMDVETRRRKFIDSIFAGKVRPTV